MTRTDSGARSIRDHFASLSTALDHNAHVATRVRQWGEQLADIYARDGRLLACGHGGSAAEAQHLTGELVGRFRDERRPLSAIALHADTSAGTAIVNDYGASQLYARQVVAHGRPGDVLMLFSTSGTSPAVVAAAKAAADAGVLTWAVTGPAPNPLASLCTDAIAVEAPSVATVQEMHLVLIHSLCTALDNALGVTP
ncbi:D-sedoheptulose-7-phosphate isomerase [Nocardia blacklockiae]|uniref:D-sedoheptulose-7-phosphate isomerase n=1 Tax=Nocardia blacklockiae TaxID=480036 RepID=UPI00189488D2|nr:SIS domain-containing protein [Nocardia blacklockiae]MBF6175327.1 SIS domain-containing protein [Nocardia blacklockiae]